MPRVKLFDEIEKLEKALELFWKKGFHATSMQDIVDHLSLNRASLYDTFGNKEELFLRAFDHYRNKNKAKIQSFFESQPDVKKGFESLLKGAIDQINEDKDRKGCFVVNTTTQMMPGDEHMASILQENQETFVQLFSNYLKEGESKGQFKKGKDLEAIARLLFTYYNGIQVVSKLPFKKKDSTKALQTLLSLLD